MGCSASRLDGLPTVSLCHDRLCFLNESLRHSYAFADSHSTYLHSLRSFSPSLTSFLRHTTSQIAAAPPLSDPQPNNTSCDCNGSNNSNSNSNSSSEAPSPNREFSSSSSDSDSEFAAYPKYDSYGDGGGGGGRAVGGGEFVAVARSWVTPSPPQPRSSSAWDFLNFFDATPYERYEFVEKEKGEEGARKNQAEAKKSSGRSRPDPTQKQAKSATRKKNQSEAKPKEVVDGGAEKKKDSCPKHGNVANETADSGEKKTEIAAKLMKELEIGFERASESGNGVLSSLDAGKSRFFSKDSVFQGASVKLFGSNDASGESGVSTSANLSTTLSKLCMWEKKLYDEVKAEEKLRIAYGKCCKKMRKILADDGGGAGTKAAAEAVGATLRTMATQMKVGIQIIDRTSTNINKLRDEELFPQITHLIQKLLEMWKSMAETHRAQFEAVSEAQSTHLLALTNAKLSDEGIESAIQLKIEIQTWALSFTSWVSTQKRCLKSLNGWLLKCLPPGDEGADYYPPVFALCDKWSNTLGALSEREVLDAVGVLLSGLNKSLEQQQHSAHGEERRAVADKEMERRVKDLEREEQRLRKLLVVQQQGIGIWKAFDGKTEDFEVGLKQVFMAIDRFAARNLEAYQQLHVQIEATRSVL